MSSPGYRDCASASKGPVPPAFLRRWLAESFRRVSAGALRLFQRTGVLAWCPFGPQRAAVVIMYLHSRLTSRALYCYIHLCIITRRRTHTGPTIVYDEDYHDDQPRSQPSPEEED